MPTIGRTLATVKLGVHKTERASVRSLVKNRIMISAGAHAILRKIPFSQTPTDIELIEVSVSELGFNKLTRYDRICDRIKKRGLDLCPGEAAVMLREFCKDPTYQDVGQGMVGIGEWTLVAMEFVTDSCFGPSMFMIGDDSSGLWLHAFSLSSIHRPGAEEAAASHLFDPEERLVVARRK